MAISKQRLKELIKQGATIWNDEWEEIKLDKNTCEICELQYLNGTHKGWCLQFQYDYEDEHHKTEVNLEDLEEDVEKGRWELEMTATRTETLKLPKYEKLPKEFDMPPFIRYDKELENFVLYEMFNSTKNEICVLFRELDDDAGDCLFRQPLTKENYLEACELYRKLWLGEQV